MIARVVGLVAVALAAACASAPGPVDTVPTDGPTGIAPERPSLRAVRARRPPKIDGVVDDAVWRSAEMTDAFTQKFPDEGQPPSERTQMRILYDDDAIYLAFSCNQELSPVVARLTRRDRDVEADYLRVALDSRGSGTGAFEFTINAAGVLSDALRFNDTEISREWDEVWEGRARTTATGWSAELRIPLRVLRFSAAATQTWGLQATRYVSARQEVDEWSSIPRDVAGQVSHYGALTEMRDLAPRNGLTVRPFAVGRISRRDPDPAVAASGVEPQGTIGAEASWNLTQDLTLDAAVNPDFGQAEADQEVLNLTNYEIQFPENRDFFLAGIDQFTTPLNVLYTRRIGTAPRLPAVLDGERNYDRAGPSTIYGAAKLVGSMGERWSISSLLALTGTNRATVITADGSRAQRVVEPFTAFGFLRVKRALRNGHLAVIATSTTRAAPLDYPEVDRPSGPPQRLCPQGLRVAGYGRCFADAYVSSVDGRWRSPSGEYAVTGQLLGTWRVIGPSLQHPDGTEISAGDTGPAALLSIAKEGGEHWVGELFGDFYGRKVDFNDLGFMQRQNMARLGVNIEYRTLEAGLGAVETHTSLFLSAKNNLDGVNIGRSVQLGTAWTLSNYWVVAATAEYRPAIFDDREIGDGTALERAAHVGLSASMTTNRRAAVALTLSTTSQVRDNGRLHSVEADLTLRPHPQLDLQILPSWLYTVGEPRYLGPGASPGELRFGDLEASTLGIISRATYTFSPRLSVQAYAQLFLAAATYRDFAVSAAGPAGPGATIELAELTAADAPAQSPAFQDGALNLSAAIRWEYKAGSTAFLVYTRSQVPRDPLAEGIEPTLALPAVYQGRTDDVLMLKVSYFWQ